MLQLQMESGLQQEVDSIFQELGISRDIAITMLYEYVRDEHRLPTGLRVPNELTRETFESTDAGKDLLEYSTTTELFASLGI